MHNSFPYFRRTQIDVFLERFCRENPCHISNTKCSNVDINYLIKSIQTVRLNWKKKRNKKYANSGDLYNL